MATPRAVFLDVVQVYRQGGVYGGVASIDAWRMHFAEMRRGLESAGVDAAGVRAFRDRLTAAIDAAVDGELRPDEKAALHAVLSSAFDQMPRSYDATRAPKAAFLRHVAFLDEESAS